MGGKLANISIFDVSGGEASCFPVSMMPTKYATLLQNFYPGENGLITKVKGYKAINSTLISETLNSVFLYTKSNGTSQLLCSGGGKIFKVTGNALTEIKTNLDVSAKVRFSQINDIVIMTNGVNQPMKYDGTTVSNLGGSPPETAFKSHVHKNRVWMIARSDKMIAYHSALNAPEDYTGTGSGYIDFKYVLKEGDELVDILTYIDLIVFVFKRHIAIYSGMTPSGTYADFSIVQLIDGIGALGTDLTIPFGTDVAILTDDGVTRLTKAAQSGNIKANILSKNIEQVLRPVISGVSSSTLIGGAHYPKYGWLLFLIGNTIYGYSYIWDAWFRIVGADAKGLNLCGNALYIPGTGYLYKYDEGYDFNGVAPKCIWKTAWFRLGGKTNLVGYPKVLELSHNMQSEAVIDIQSEYDFREAMPENITQYRLGAKTIELDNVDDFDALNPLDGPVLPYETIRIPLFGKGSLMRLIFSNESVDGPIELASLSINYEVGGIR